MLIKVIIHEPYSFECCHVATMPFGTDSLAPVPPDNDVVAALYRHGSQNPFLILLSLPLTELKKLVFGLVSLR